ncbi:Glutamine transport ATP-binding protein GlnQ [Baekduia alba]|uniref:hypothetical protein n=1 Tax=Baekduia alba TaxID=2997333 RepID=UPI00233FA3FF|nr:hypothetical protein [Baekduia alba]WCB91551.1 Glutamine transport ATP-binding protein GlnQ [Baekduia alba]
MHEQILDWPAGYDTVLDPTTLSGGQMQRLTVSRALLRTLSGAARMMLLDEITAPLDAVSAERLLEDVLSYLAEKGIGALIIAHKLPVHARVQRVLVIDKGRVVEDGDPRTLAANPRTHYARMFRAGH